MTTIISKEPLKTKRNLGQLKTFESTRLVAFIAGLVAAVATTTLTLSITSSPRDGFDIHYADILLLVLIYSAIRLKIWQLPHISMILFSGLLLLSVITADRIGLSLYSGLRFSIILIVFSSLREVISSHKKEFFYPILGVSILSLIVALGYQFAFLNETHPWGLHGQQNVAAGVSAVIALSSLPSPLAIFPLLLLALTGSRGGALGLLPGLLFLGKKGLFLFVLLLVAFGAAQLITNRTTSLAPAGIIGQTETATGVGLQTGARLKMMQNSLAKTTIYGHGFDAGTQYEATNPHNIYVILLNNLGWIFGGMAIGILFWIGAGGKSLLKKVTWKKVLHGRFPFYPPLISILAIGMVDHYWITTAQGMYLFAAVLAIATWKTEEEKYV